MGGSERRRALARSKFGKCVAAARIQRAAPRHPVKTGRRAQPRTLEVCALRVRGMAALRTTYFGTRQPSREAIIEELTQATLHGFPHRQN